jgi:23S rRNA (uracil1939-C5)-methyltransferase
MMRSPTDRPARPAEGEEVTLLIDRLAYGGRGVGRADGFVIFVPDTAPGDRARVRLRRVKKTYAEAQVVEVERPSPLRTPPPCPHFGPCGGCIWQHIEYAAQSAAKEEIVRDSLAHIANVRDVAIRPILTMADPWRYRNKMEFTFHPHGVLGLHRRGAFDRIAPIEACLLQTPLANEVLGLVRTFAVSSGLSRYDPRDHTGLLRQLVIREARATGEVMVGLITTSPEVPGIRALAARLASAVPRITSVLHGINPGPSDGVPLAAVSLLAGRPYIIEELAGLRFRIGLETFFQTNTTQAERLAGVVEALADLRGDEIVYDLYCGVGTFTLLLARRARRVYGVEVASAAVDAARENAAENGISNVEFASGDVRRVLPDIHRRAGPPHLVVLDPPRGGAGSRVMRRIAAVDAGRILYISCNPTTLAPDLKDLVAAGYAVRTVQPLDLFPHTYHVECAVLLAREAARGGPAS